jgi:HAD superfamily hydrolase (TIGR01450 family)
MSAVTVVLDLDGVIWLADRAIPGSPEAFGRLRAAGEEVLFFTNNSYPTLSDHVRKLAGMGIEIEPEEMLTSAQAGAMLVEPGEHALVCGGPGISEALTARGVEAVDVGDPDGLPAGTAVDAVLVGWDRRFDYERLRRASDAVRAGARLIGTNDDATYPTPGGQIPGGGALLAAVACASGATPVVAGKPHAPAAELVRRRNAEIGGRARIGAADRSRGGDGIGGNGGRGNGVGDVAVGDRPSTDGGLARRLGWTFALVLSGVTPAGHGPLDPEPDIEAPDLATLVDKLLAGSG